MAEQQALDISRPERELTRTGLGLKKLGLGWQYQPRGERFLDSLLTFLGSLTRPNTRRSYSFAILEFWGWLSVTKKVTPTPDRVRRADAFAFADWLRSRTLGLDEYRLEQDPDRALDLAIYRIILESPSVRIGSIRKKLLASHRFSKRVSFLSRGSSHSLDVLEIEANEPRGDALEAYVQAHDRKPPNALDIKLACLVEHKLLSRNPTVSMIRSGAFVVDENDHSRAQLDYRVDPDLFSYFVDTHTEASGGERASTVAQRLTALSSFWGFLIDTGENKGSEQLIQHNIWTAPLKASSKNVASRKAVARELTTPSLELITRLIAVTFVRSHGASEAYEAAAATIDGVDVSASAVADPTIYDLRDRSLLLFGLLVGTRAEEMTVLRRSDITRSTPALIAITGKGDKQRLVRVPDVVLRALGDFSVRLDELAASAKPFARIQGMIERASPLFPSLKLWGRNEQEPLDPESVRGLTRSAIAMMMRRRATLAGVKSGSDELRRIHPHGLRHLAGQLASARGVDARTIQATLGHTSLATTGIYVEERDPAKRSLVPDVGAPLPAEKIVVSRAEPEVIEARAEVVEEREIRPVEDIDLEPGFFEEEEQEEVVPAAEVELSEVVTPLVGMGEIPEEPIYMPSERAVQLADESRSVEYLLDVYKDNWGEQGKRTRFESGASGPLAHVYVGKRSGLPWWQGMKGQLKDPEFSYTPNPNFPTMPVISPAQFLGTGREPISAQPLFVALVDLWDRWFDDEERGPTAAMALSTWIRTCAIITRDVEEVMIRRGSGWAAFEAPLDDTRADPSAYPKVLREHLDGAIVSWFEAVGWQHRPLMESREPTGTALDVPSWYGDTDPLSSIPSRERDELFDWLNVFVGLPPRDRTPRFEGGLSRRDVGEFISTICQFEMVKGDDDLNLMGGIDKKMKQQSLQVLNQQIKTTVGQLTSGRIRDFDYQTLRRLRKVDRTRQEMKREAAGRTGTAEEKGEELRSMYSKYLAPYTMGVVTEMFGTAAGSDPVLELFSYCTSGSPLAQAGDRYKDLFRVAGDTISHTSEFSAEFARETGQHSECVARRLVRHLYEESKPQQWAKRRNWPETIEALDTMASYRVPCPRSQESELAARLQTREAVPIFEEWQRAQRQVISAVEPEETPLRAVYEEEAGRTVSKPTRPARQLERNPRAGSHDKLAAARSYLPNAALLSVWSSAMS